MLNQVVSKLLTRPDLLDLYALRLLGDRTDQLPRVKPYQEFAVWQSGQRVTKHFQKAYGFWRERWMEPVVNQLSCLDLECADNEREKGRTGSSVEVLVTSGALVDRIGKVCTALDVKPNVVFLAAFAILLLRSTGKRRVTTWITCPNRENEGTEQMLGWLSNLHMIALDVSLRMRAIDVVEQCRTVIRNTRAHQALPLPMLWCELGENRTATTPPIIFDWQSDRPLASVGELSAERIRMPNRRSPVSLGLCLSTVQQPHAFRTSAIYSNAYFDAEDVRRWLSDFSETLDILVGDLDARGHIESLL